MSLFDKYERQLTKARIDKATAERIESKFSSPASAFAMIDNVFMKAKFSGLTKNEIIDVIDSGVFQDNDFTSDYLIGLKPYLVFWPNDPKFAALVNMAGISAIEVGKIGVDNIHREALETMIALR